MQIAITPEIPEERPETPPHEEIAEQEEHEEN